MGRQEVYQGLLLGIFHSSQHLTAASGWKEVGTATVDSLMKALVVALFTPPVWWFEGQVTHKSQAFECMVSISC